MKKVWPYLILPLLLLFSCGKEHSPANVNQKKYEVNFNVSGFSQQLNNFASAKRLNKQATNALTGLAASIDLLYYYVYDSSGNLVSQTVQDSTASNFGTISDHLSAGTYTVVFVGGKTGIMLTNTSTLGPASIAGYAPNYLPWKDTFFDKFQLTVSTGDVSQSVDLHRIVGELSIHLLDKLPANAASIELTVSTEFEFFSFLTATSYTSGQSYTAKFVLPAASLGQSDYRNNLIMINTTIPFTATIVCYDSSRKILGQTTVNNVTLQGNTQTILTGDLFGGNNGFNIGLNQGWGSNPVNIQF